MSDAKKSKVIAVVGPTASGKTSLAISLAKEFDGEVISCDSRQVYRGLDEGTAKVTEGEMSGVPHHLIDVVDIDTIYTATDFKQDAEAAITDITARGRVSIIAGGTFFYLEQLKRGDAAAAPVAPDPDLRAELEKRDVQELYQELQTKDPKRAAEVDPENKRRIVRSLEIVAALGSVPVQLSADTAYHFLTLGISIDKETLRTRIRSRAHDWLAGPFETEVRQLLVSGVTRERLQEIGFEYLLMLEYIDGSIDDETFIQKCVEKNWQYAKRQYTWLKRDDSIHWLKRDNLDEALPLVRDFLS